MAFHRRALETINAFEMKRSGVQTFPVNNQMPIISDSNPLAAQSHQPFDVKLVLRQHVDAFGFENDDFSTLGPPEIIGYAVDEQMVAGEDLQFDNIFAFLESLTIPNAS